VSMLEREIEQLTSLVNMYASGGVKDASISPLIAQLTTERQEKHDMEERLELMTAERALLEEDNRVLRDRLLAVGDIATATMATSSTRRSSLAMHHANSSTSSLTSHALLLQNAGFAESTGTLTAYPSSSEDVDDSFNFLNELCDKLGLYKPMVEQPQYNMIHRKRFEVEYAGVFEKYKLGATVWSPLAAGILTGKYLNDPNAAGRIQGMNPHTLDSFYHYSEWFGPEKIEKSRGVFKELEGIAKSLGGTLTQLALAWVLRNKDVSSIICAFTQISYVEENVKAVEMYKKFTPEIDEKIEKLLGNQPETDFSFGKMRKETSRRYL